jgi:hypothetical protein
MEKIVCSNKQLSWDGWDVVRYSGNSSFMDREACFKNGRWIKKTVYSLKENGWDIPNSIGEIDAGLEG